MALNPQLLPSGLPLLFVNETLVFARDDVEFQVDNIPGAPGGRWSAKGRIYLSSVRMVFVAARPQPPIMAFDMPLLYVHEHKFNQPIFACNNLSGKVYPVYLPGQDPTPRPPHSFKILFKEGGAGTFVPFLFNLIRTMRLLPGVNQGAHGNGPLGPVASPAPASQPPVHDMVRQAFMDPNDPTMLYIQQPDEGQAYSRQLPYTLPSHGS